MTGKIDPALGVNGWFEEELYQEYLHDRRMVHESWKKVFDGNGSVKPAPASPPAAEGEYVALRGAAARIAGNMEASLAVPTASSQRTIPVKVVDENRTIINQHLTLVGRPKVSYTHLIGWAIVRALESYPNLNNAFAERDGEPFKQVRPQVNFGLAIDVAAKDGGRALVVPSVKNAGAMNFQQFVAAYEDLVARARAGTLTVEDFSGTTISLTNPGTVGTVGSIPRLMAGQGAIIASGAIDYPAEYRGAAPDTRAALGISKVMTLTCTYDHRILQGAESGLFLAKVQALLDGEEQFYEEIFADLRLPHRPVRWEPDRKPAWPGGGERTAEIAKQAAVLQLINAYRVRGHLIADLDPLGAEPSYHPELDPATYGLTIWDLDREFITGSLSGAMGDGSPHPVATLRQILETLRQTYCGKIGCEYMNIQVPEQKRWLQLRMEPTANRWPLEKATRVRILDRLIEAEEFEHFLHARFVGHKRFSLEGSESAMAILDELARRAAAGDAHEIVIGMAHRGRLTIVANLVGKPLEQIFSSFEMEEPASSQGSGDVKYHLGASGVRTFEDGREIVISVSPNPSHLEAVDPVVEGIVRPKQDRLGDGKRRRVIPLLIHGDAAFAGQGVVAETLNLSQLDGYSTGGTVHLIINNQIGFTTPPEEARSTPYSTDVARMVQAPIFHVNGDDPEAAIRTAQLAFDYRQQFSKDVVIDMFCYRRHGHNEADDPSYTQPLLYKKIREHPSVAALYSERLMREGVVGQADVDRIRDRVKAWLREGFEAAQQREENFEVQELTPVEPTEPLKANTAVDRATLERIVRALTEFPEDFHLHPKLRTFVERRRDAYRKGGPIDWALAEALAFGSLVAEGTPVRLSGQDSSRGTFTQRHAVFYDYEDGHEHCPLKHVAPGQARFDVYDSLLSEEAVLGFEFGYSLGDPLSLVLWEAQFGDFANNAQGMIDQFIAGSEVKWQQPSGLALLLPHGYEGQGPEHSSARIERFLQLAADGNLQVIYPSTPAQYFHLLRRQMHGGHDRRGIRKPLVVFTPKSLLRHLRAVSSVDELAGGLFREVIGETGPIEAERVTRVLLSTGKVYWDLLAAREQKKAENVALIRIEQLYPFPCTEVQDVLLRYPVTAEVFWVQEEPRNMGAWRFVQEQVQPLIAQTRRVLGYVGRSDSAATATGSHRRHEQEQRELIEEAFASSESRSNIRVIGRRRAR
jgi:2-oxoglutarate decarboxylase